MTQLIVLPLAVVDRVFPVDVATGDRALRSGYKSSLCPIPLASGLEFILPIEALTDPQHADLIAQLAANPDVNKRVNLAATELRREVLPSEFRAASRPAP